MAHDKLKGKNRSRRATASSGSRSEEASKAMRTPKAIEGFLEPPPLAMDQAPSGRHPQYPWNVPRPLIALQGAMPFARSETQHGIELNMKRGFKSEAGPPQSVNGPGPSSVYSVDGLNADRLPRSSKLGNDVRRESPFAWSAKDLTHCDPQKTLIGRSSGFRIVIQFALAVSVEMLDPQLEDECRRLQSRPDFRTVIQATHRNMVLDYVASLINLTRPENSRHRTRSKMAQIADALFFRCRRTMWTVSHDPSINLQEDRPIESYYSKCRRSRYCPAVGLQITSPLFSRRKGLWNGIMNAIKEVTSQLDPGADVQSNGTPSGRRHYAWVNHTCKLEIRLENSQYGLTRRNLPCEAFNRLVRFWAENEDIIDHIKPRHLLMRTIIEQRSPRDPPENLPLRTKHLHEDLITSLAFHDLAYEGRNRPPRGARSSPQEPILSLTHQPWIFGPPEHRITFHEHAGTLDADDIEVWVWFVFIFWDFACRRILTLKRDMHWEPSPFQCLLSRMAADKYFTGRPRLFEDLFNRISEDETARGVQRYGGRYPDASLSNPRTWKQRKRHCCSAKQGCGPICLWPYSDLDYPEAILA